MIPLFMTMFFLAGWVLATREHLRRRMMVMVCAVCGRDQHYDADGRKRDNHYVKFWEKDNPPKQPPDIPRGLFRERNGKDVAVAVTLALFWPVTIAILMIVNYILVCGDLFTWMVNKMTPLTAPERERREQWRQAEIQRLSEEIGSN